MEERFRKVETQVSFMRRRLDALEEIVAERVGPAIRLPEVVDPPPEDLFNVRLIDLIRRFRGGVVDPVPEDFSNVRIRDLVDLIPGGGVVDPAPEDLSRLNRDQLQARLDEIEVATKRLENLQAMVQEQLANL